MKAPCRVDREAELYSRLGNLLIALLAGLSCVGCGGILLHRLESDARSSAVLYADDLRNKGTLPGLNPEDHCEMILGNAGSIILHAGIKYPLEVTVWARKTGDTEKATYAYLFSKVSPDSEWKLVGACKMCASNNIWYIRPPTGHQ